MSRSVARRSAKRSSPRLCAQSSSSSRDVWCAAACNARPRSVRRTIDLWGWALTLLEEPADNGDAALVFEARTRSGGVVPPHTESNHESFHVLEGVFEIEVDGETHRCAVGDHLAIAPGVLHSLRNAGRAGAGC
jgi:quercetin dioxygenase-like cupin family protein